MLEQLLSAAAPARPRLTGALQEEQIRTCVQLVLDKSAPEVARERRRHERNAYPYPVYLTPLDEQQGPRCDDTLVVIGRHLSELGLGFYHSEAVPFRRCIASFKAAEQEWIALLFELSWTRYNRNGWYDGGGHFLAVSASPFAGSRG